MNRYPHLLSPFRLGTLELRNRAVMGSMHTGLEDKPWDVPKQAAFFAARARGGAALMVTGGYAVNRRGWLKPFAGEMVTRLQSVRHEQVTGAVHEAGGLIAMQLLHSGRYGYHPFNVSASAVKSPITPFKPRALSSREVDQLVKDFARSARLAQKAGYDAVEIMGSEGYLINQFLAERTNQRTDMWGGTAANRHRFPVEIVRRTRELVGDDFPLVFRLSLVDLVEGGQTWEETIDLAYALQDAGVSVLNTGIGWHEARVPTIITQVPRGAWVDYTARLKAEVAIPVFKELRLAGVVPCGLGARDTLRLEVCFPLHGNELTPERNPIEAGLGWACKEATGFLGSPAVARARAEGTAERLVPFTIEGAGIPREGNPVLGARGEHVGVVTSGTFAPSLEVGAGMAYVRSDLAEPGTEVEIDVLRCVMIIDGVDRVAAIRAAIQL